MHNSKHLTCINSFNLHNRFLRYFPHFTDGETEVTEGFHDFLRLKHLVKTWNQDPNPGWLP